MENPFRSSWFCVHSWRRRIQHWIIPLQSVARLIIAFSLQPSCRRLWGRFTRFDHTAERCPSVGGYLILIGFVGRGKREMHSSAACRSCDLTFYRSWYRSELHPQARGDRLCTRWRPRCGSRSSSRDTALQLLSQSSDDVPNTCDQVNKTLYAALSRRSFRNALFPILSAISSPLRFCLSNRIHTAVK